MRRQDAPTRVATTILRLLEGDDPRQADLLLALVYDDLRRIACTMYGREKHKITLQPTALVHEAYLRLLKGSSADKWSGRAHFYAAAARSMKQILVDHARKRNTGKRGGKARREGDPEIALSTVADESAEPDSMDLLELDAALSKLEQESPKHAEVIHLHFFAGLSHAEVAEVLQVTERTVERRWAIARAWLHKEMSSEQKG